MRCGDEKCCTSTGIDGGLTFGQGKLDEYGYWQYPCEICAEDWENRRADEKEVFAKTLMQNGLSEADASEYVNQSEWLNTPAWPKS
jgi:hypothetical protein